MFPSSGTPHDSTIKQNLEQSRKLYEEPLNPAPKPKRKPRAPRQKATPDTLTEAAPKRKPRQRPSRAKAKPKAPTVIDPPVEHLRKKRHLEQSSDQSQAKQARPLSHNPVPGEADIPIQDECSHSLEFEEEEEPAVVKTLTLEDTPVAPLHDAEPNRSCKDKTQSESAQNTHEVKDARTPLDIFRTQYSTRAYDEANLKSKPARFNLPGFCGERSRTATLEEFLESSSGNSSDDDPNLVVSPTHDWGLVLYIPRYYFSKMFNLHSALASHHLGMHHLKLCVGNTV